MKKYFFLNYNIYKVRKKITFMIKQFTSNNIENEESNFNSEERDYEILITRLKEINLNIVSLKKTIIR